MKFHGITLEQGSKVSNLTVASGSSFPASPDDGELFFRSDADVRVKGLYLYIAGSWDRIASTDSLTLPNGISLPESANEGDVFYLNSDDSNEGLYVHRNAVWTNVGGSTATFVVTGDVTGTLDGGTDVLTLSTTGVSAGIYGAGAQTLTVTVDNKGRLSAVSAITSTPAFSSITGLPTTLAGYGITDGQPLDADLTALAALSTTGLVTRTGSGTAVTRTVDVTGGGLSITNANGVAGNPTITSNATALNTVSTLVLRDGSGNFAAGNITATLSGNAASATVLETPRNFSLTGDVTAAAVPFNGSAPVSLETVLGNTPVTAAAYGSTTQVATFTVNAQGRLTLASNASIAFPVTSVAGRTGNVVLTTADIGGYGTVLDSAFTLQDNGDVTKQARFEVSGISTETTRIFTLPNLDATLAHVSNATQNFAGQTTFSNATLTFGNATTASTTNVASGVTTTGNTKTVNIGTSGAAGSTTLINVGGANGTTINLAGQVLLAADPTQELGAATKQYVDNLASGLDMKASVRVATTSNITLSGTQTIDGVAVVAGDRVLVKNQATASQNGIYVAAAGAWARSADADNSPVGEVTSGLYTFVEEGSQTGNSGWVLGTANPITLGTTALTFVQFTGLGQVTAGAGLTKSGNTIHIGTVSSARIVVNADNIDLATVTDAGGGNFLKFARDTYGRVTGTAPVEAGDITTALGFTPVNRAGDLMAGALGIVAGTATAPGLYFSGDTNTGIFSPGADTVAFSTAGSERARINSAGNVSIGGVPTNERFFVGGSSTGATTTVGILSAPTVQSDVTVAHSSFASFPSTVASSFTTQALMHYNASQGTFGAGSNVNLQYGFRAQANLVGAANNYAFVGEIPAATNRWNLFMSGTATNYLAGKLVSASFLDVVIDGTTAQIQVNGTSNSTGSQSITRNNSDAAGPLLYLAKGKSAVGVATDALAQDDFLGSIIFAGTNTSAYSSGATMRARAAGTWSSSSTPTRLEFLTAPSGSTTQVERMRIDSAGNVLIGAVGTNQRLLVGGSSTGGTNTAGIVSSSVVQSDVTASHNAIATFPSTAAATFNLQTLRHFSAASAAFGAGSSVTTQIGFLADTSLTGATSNYGFFGGIPAAAGRWNLFMDGTAQNWFAGNVGIGPGRSVPAVALDVNGTVSAGSLTVPAGSITVNQATLSTTSTTVTNTTLTTVDSVAATAVRSAKYLVQIHDTTNSHFHVVEILVIHNGTTVWESEYSEVVSNAPLGVFDTVISGGNLNLTFQATAATSKNIKVLRTALLT